MVSSPPPSCGALPERSRNAKAQARHRAKRKAYITHLEQSVTRLSAIAGVDAPTADLSQETVDRVQQLEDENAELRSEIERLRAQLGQTNSSPTTAKRASFPGLSSESPYTLPSSIKPSPPMRPIFTESRTSSYGSAGATSPSHPHHGSYYGLATAGATASPTSSSSTGSPFSPSTTSPLALPGLKLPPTPGEQRPYNGSSSFPSANDHRSSLPSLPRMLPSLGSYSSYGDTSPSYAAKPEHESPSTYQMSQQHSPQTFTNPSYSFDPYATSVDTWASSRARV